MTSSNADCDYIDLDRTFYEFPKNARESDDVDLLGMFHAGDRLRWRDLINEYRVVILSEAGSGKTAEIRSKAQQLRGQGKAAFFLRLEHILDGLEGAFEVGSNEEFLAWLASSDDGWLLLDSVDEARLRHPSDFERAIRILGRRVALANERAHIFITGRTFAWRPKTDLALCISQLPFTRPIVEVSTEKADADLDDNPSDHKLRTQRRLEIEALPAFKIVALDDLSSSQIEVFAKAHGIDDTNAFLDAIERGDASTFATRPQDLQDLIAFWLDRRKIGTRLELMQNSIDRRLAERDQSRAEARPLSTERTREGAQMLAAATTLAKEPTVRVPDGMDNKTGIAVNAVLPSWDEKDQAALLSRPIFDEAIYGAVRFHHRSVREYLAAEWFAKLLRSETSRRKVEALFFRNQYGLEVVPPTLRPLLPWLAILDEKIRDRLLRVSPEIIFEGGDPSQLPLGTRRQILDEVCENLVRGTSDRSVADYSALQRFANIDLTGDVQRLLQRHRDNEELTSFLLRMVWLGQLKGALPEAKAAALLPNSPRYTRIAAFRAVAAVGSPQDAEDIRQSFLSDSEELSRDWLGELVEKAEPTQGSVSWLLACLAKCGPAERHNADQLSQSVVSFTRNTALDLLPSLLTGLSVLLSKPPIVERRHCEISKRFAWLLEAAGLAIRRLIEVQCSNVLRHEVLEVFQKIQMARQFMDVGSHDVHQELQKLVPEWPDLNRALFWGAVATSRQHLDGKKNERLIDYWHVDAWEAFWRFERSDFDYVVGEIGKRPLQDDKLVALSLAISLYRNAQRPRTWRERLKRAVRGNEELFEKLTQFFRPPVNTDDARQWKRRESQRKKRADDRKLREQQNREEWKRRLSKDVDKIRDPGFTDPRGISVDQWHLLGQMCGDEGFARSWTGGNWKTLIPEFGEAVARALRDGAVAFWRKSDPVLYSEGAMENSTPGSVIFGLAGLGIEAAETDNWAEKLSKADVERACRYASFELNGFPKWFPSLFGAHSDVVGDFLIREINFELSTEIEGRDLNYILSDVSWSGQWAWTLLGPRIAEILNAKEPINTKTLDRLLAILQGSALLDAEIAKLAEAKSKRVSGIANLARWYAIWVGAAPDAALSALQQFFNEMPVENKTSFAMEFITNLVGGRRSEKGGARKSYQTPKHLASLYLMMHTHIHHRDDVDRAGTGVYSPDLRDNAQDSRNTLFELLNNIPGKDAFLALAEISAAHPNEELRPRFTYLMQVKAQSDSDLEPWLPQQVRDFNDKFERTPMSHRELAELATLRLLDLKDDLEQGDASLADILLKGATLETQMRRYIGRELREKAFGRYSIPQEEELADAKRPDLRFQGAGFDGPVPVELKLADNWTGPDLFERLENQLCGDYLRDNRSNRGLFVLVHRGEKLTWELPETADRIGFSSLVEALQRHWNSVSGKYPGVEEVVVIGIDLAKRNR